MKEHPILFPGAMKEHPILFTAPMVRAILEGRKTQTRRPIKGQSQVPDGAIFERRGLLSWAANDAAVHELWRKELRAPFAVGDRLWVRETFSHLLVTEDHHYIAGGDLQCRDRTRLVTTEDIEEWDGEPPSAVAYKASHSDEQIQSWGVHREMWRPSIHMPRWASRLTLEVTDIRPERVQSIIEADAIAEGARFFPDLPPDPKFRPSGPHCRWSMYEPKTDAQCLGSAAFAFGNAWNHIYGDGPFAWANNPWVWATTFKVVTP